MANPTTIDVYDEQAKNFVPKKMAQGQVLVGTLPPDNITNAPQVLNLGKNWYVIPTTDDKGNVLSMRQTLAQGSSRHYGAFDSQDAAKAYASSLGGSATAWQQRNPMSADAGGDKTKSAPSLTSPLPSSVPTGLRAAIQPKSQAPDTPIPSSPAIGDIANILPKNTPTNIVGDAEEDAGANEAKKALDATSGVSSPISMEGIAKIASGPSANISPKAPKLSKLGALAEIFRGISPVASELGALYGSAQDQEFYNKQQALKMQGKEVESQATLREAQAEQMRNTIPIDVGNGRIMYLPAKFGTDILKQQVANQGKVDVAKINKRFQTSPAGLYDTQTGQLIKDTGAGIVITPEIAQQYSLPAEFVGKPMKLAELANIEKSQAMSNTVVNAPAGPFMVNKITGKGKLITDQNGKPVGNQQAYISQLNHELSAKYGIAITTTGETVSRWEALHNRDLHLATGNPILGKGLASYSPAYDADMRLKQMYEQAIHPNPASDKALLFNHIGMTLSAQKGARITQAEIDAHLHARDLPSDLMTAWDKVSQGFTLSPVQRKNFLRLAIETRNTIWQRSASEGLNYGVPLTHVATDPELPPVPGLENYVGNPEPVAPAEPESGEGNVPPMLNNVVKPQSQQPRKVGETKVFPNGNIGVWDGKGYVQIQTQGK